ncbi:MAG: YceI family protein [Bacteroidetes bacterium]|nr:YceI family protein [Bacteroidota bacterium]MBU1580141.1 YceI family protein [Bacteroidota bacterium]MBU2465389.1 YceI family protein [Bacteroidota bacterium]MBU2558866.1 YceI family protein [Bacteroidota bacterium]
MKVFGSSYSFSIVLVVGIAALLVLHSFAAGIATVDHSEQQDEYIVESKQGRVFWRADAHRGVIPLCEGKLVFFEKKLVDARFRVCMDSLRNTDIDYELMRVVFENTMKSKEIFHTSRFPFSNFTLCCAEQLGNDSLLIAGDLEIKEINNCIRFKTYLSRSGDSLIINSDTIYIDRTNWGIFAMSKTYGAGEESYIVSDTIQFQIRLSGIRSKKE